MCAVQYRYCIHELLCSTLDPFYAHSPCLHLTTISNSHHLSTLSLPSLPSFLHQSLRLL